jgi:hypothetical protein
LEIIE